ncbi:CYTH domain-containing protein [Myxococcota bacterium]|nr:CYTH domain-containing protein [Myxococcota bacterium]
MARSSEGLEIERKFLVRGEPWREASAGMPLIQGYLSLSGAKATVRIRVGPEAAWLTVKGPVRGLSRAEFEFEIERSEGQAMLKLCDRQVEKTRYLLHQGEHVWEVDVFEGANAGLVVAEIELSHEEEVFESPDWLGEEVSFEKRYRNSALAKRPYSSWSESD